MYNLSCGIITHKENVPSKPPPGSKRALQVNPVVSIGLLPIETHSFLYSLTHVHLSSKFIMLVDVSLSTSCVGGGRELDTMPPRKKNSELLILHERHDFSLVNTNTNHWNFSNLSLPLEFSSLKYEVFSLE